VTVKSYIADTGTIIASFLTQDSGNTCHVVDTGTGMRWLKILNLTQTPLEDCTALVEFYNSLRSELIPTNWNLVRLEDGCLLECDAVQGEVLRSADEDRSDPASAYQRFQRLPAPDRLDVFQAILKLFVEIESTGIIVEDFYDGCIIHDFTSGHTHVCDLDHIHHGPYVLRKDRQFGSSRFMAPEEYQRGCLIDWRTNVFTMGATGFVLLNDNVRQRDSWSLGESLFDVLERATSRNRHIRYPDVASMSNAWMAAN
jgi:serine/threonine-protein kinase